MSGATLLHVSDLHFGVHSLADQVQKLEALIARGTFTVVAVSGDLTQRARAREFARARTFLADAEEHSRTIAVPGNHDIAWWRAPLRIGVPSLIHAKWRRHLGRETDPVLRIPGVTIVGLNTAHGISPRTLTTRLRDLSVIGDLLDAQLEHAAHTFSTCEPGERRVIVMHHNPVAGEISRRYGMSHHAYVLDRFAEMGVDLVLCGHDHQEAIHMIERERHGIVVATAGTITTRSRGGRPVSVNAIRLDERGIAVRTLVWDSARGDFVAGSERRFGA